MNLYLYAPGTVSASCEMQDETGKRMAISEPDYTQFIPPMQLRRMSKAVRMGVAAARMCLQHPGAPAPDALSIGTAMGCLQDTETFLGKMVEQDESMLTPTAFIQSTHNTVAGQIALVLGCNGHNLTFAHRGHSTEHALLNAWLYLRQHPVHTVLTGGIDELSDSSYALMERAGIYREVPAGEGAGFFLASLQAPPNDGLLLQHLFLAQACSPQQAAGQFSRQIAEQQFAPGLLLSGETSDEGAAAFYAAMKDRLPGVEEQKFKQQTGEYATATAAALSQLMLQVPTPRKVLLLNHYLDCYSCYLLEITKPGS